MGSDSPSPTFPTNRPSASSAEPAHPEHDDRASVPMPPITTAGTVPNHAAVTPDSNSPSWFDAPMNIELTADTRPRIASGVRSCTSDMPHDDADHVGDAPRTTSAASDSANERDTPNDDGRDAEERDAGEHPAPGAALERVTGEPDRHRRARRPPAPSAAGPVPTVPCAGCRARRSAAAPSRRRAARRTDRARSRRAARAGGGCTRCRRRPSRASAARATAPRARCAGVALSTLAR